MLRILVISLLFICASINAQKVKLKKVFNEKDLKGWVIPKGNIWWTVHNKVLEATRRRI